MFFLKRFGSHYAIERFGVIFLSLTLCMCILVGFIVAQKLQYDRRQLSGNAVYTQSFTMSQSRAAGIVIGIYSDENHTRCLILLSFEDMSLLPVDANDYTLILSGAESNGAYAPIQSHPSAIIYVLGTTGNVGIYLQDIGGFPSQLLQMYLRSNVNLTGGAGSTDDFNRYDQALIYFNPGGTYATHADFLEQQDWTLFDMVEEISRDKELSLRSMLRDDLFEMAQQQVLMESYAASLEKMGVLVPETPYQIRDTVYALPTDGSTANRLHYITTYGGGWVDDSGNQGYRTDDVTFYLDSDYVVPGGFDFDWQDGRLLTGYLESLTGSSNLTDWAVYLSQRTGAASENSFASSVASLSWVMSNGSPIELDEAKIVTQRDRDILTTINNLKSAWNTYYSLKVTYSAQHLLQLLQLEIDNRNAVDSYTVNVGDGTPVLTIV